MRLVLMESRMGDRMGECCAMVSNHTLSDEGDDDPRSRGVCANMLLQGWLILVMNWTSLIFGSSTNFIIPLVLYISSKTYSASTVDTTGKYIYWNHLYQELTTSQIGGDLFVLHREDSSASSRRRSIHAARRSLESLPRLVTTSGESDPRFPYHVPTSPLLVVHSPPISRRGSLVNGTSATKSSNEVDGADGWQEGPGSNLDLNSTPLRVIYSPSVSRSGSVGHSERPSIVITQDDDSGTDAQVVSPEDESAPAGSFQAPSSRESNIYRRGRNNSNASNTASGVPRNNTSLPAAAGRSSSPARRLAFEESGYREHLHAPPVFVAFPQTKWIRPMLAAKSILGFVCCAVLGNLIYT